MPDPDDDVNPYLGGGYFPGPYWGDTREQLQRIEAKIDALRKQTTNCE
jgi:hypothetical protein